MKKIQLILILLLLFSYTPQLAAAKPNEESTNTATTENPPKIAYQWDKAEEGFYHFSFTSDTSKVSSTDKLNTFIEQLTKFKKDHSNEKVIGYQPIYLPDNSITGYTVSTEKKTINGTILAAIITGIITALIGLSTLIYTMRNNRKTLFVNSITSERVKWMGQLKEYVAEFISLASFYNEKPILEDAKEKGEYLDKIVHAKAKINLHLNYRGDEDKKIMKLVDKMSENIMKTYDALALLKKSDKEKVAYVLEKNKEQLDKRIFSKMDKIIEEDIKSQNHRDANSFNKIASDIIRESQNEEIEIFNDRFKKEFSQLKSELQNNSDILLQLTQKYLKEEWNRVKEEAEKGNISK
ncbi:hypothetical protein V7068_22345 [Bacillus sp. JJ634]